MLYRYKIISYEDKRFEDKTIVNEYDEYIYLEKRKRKDKRYIFDAKNFLTFDYDDAKIYNMLLPDLSRFKEGFLKDSLDDTYYKEFSKYLKWHRVSSLKNRQNNITKFWDFFENQILKFKGIKNNNFFFYLKEIEFKFNYNTAEQIKILGDICILNKA
jgi:transposase-like protein